MARFTAVGLGELLWDLLPSGPQLGGAPSNFAYFAAMLGDDGIVASCVGTDHLGHDALHRLQRLGLATAQVQVDEQHATGTVQVQVDEQGQPYYIIASPVAWDFLAWTLPWQRLASQADAVCFGSIAQRSAQSRDTILKFLRATPPRTLRIFDVNLRQSFYSADLLDESLRLAGIVKVNTDELAILAELLHLSGENEEQCARLLLRRYDLDLVCVTRGTHGSCLLTTTEILEHPGFSVGVADTVGSGDAFTAALVHCWLRHMPLAMLIQFANRLGAWVATQVGATPPIETQDLDSLFKGLQTAAESKS